MAERQILSQLTTKNPHQNNDTIENRTIILNKKNETAFWYPLKLE